MKTKEHSNLSIMGGIAGKVRDPTESIVIWMNISCWHLFDRERVNKETDME